MNDRILPYSTIEELWCTYEDFEDFACAIEQAVLAKVADIQELRKDAERYRWLRNGGNDDIAVVTGLTALMSDQQMLLAHIERVWRASNWTRQLMQLLRSRNETQT